MNMRVHHLGYQQQTAITFTIINKNETTDPIELGYIRFMQQKIILLHENICVQKEQLMNHQKEQS